MPIAPVQISLPNMISGVSQQPPSLRLSTNFEKMDNAWPSVVTGLNKRPPTEHVAVLQNSVSNGVAGHIIDRGDDYRFIVTISDGHLRVLNTLGQEQPVLTPVGNTYLGQAVNPVQDFRFLTLADTTFVLNKRVVCRTEAIFEGGTSTYAPDGVVPTAADLPTGQAIGRVYQANDTGKLYQYRNLAGTQDTYRWDYLGGSYLTPPNTGPQYAAGTLPSPPKVLGYEAVIYGDTLEEPPVGQIYTSPAPGVLRKYSAVKVVLDQPGLPVRQQWVEVQLRDVASVEGDRLSPDTSGTIYVTQSISNSYYAVFFDGVKKAEFLTGNGTSAATSVESTAIIAQALATQLIALGYTLHLQGSTISIKNLDPLITISTLANNGDKALRCYRGYIDSFSNLPPNEIEGRVVRVKGDTKTNADDYYVRFRKGIWEETVAYGEREGLLNTTMPHVLFRQQNGTWVFQPHNWSSRQAGDSNSNINPSFNNQTLNDIFLYSNRLGFLSGENVVLSEANNFENFYRTTLTQVIDSDPIDLAVFSKVSDQLQHAIPFNKDILLMGSMSQYRFSYQQFVGPKNVNSQFTTSFNCSKDVTPVNMGGSIYFVDDRQGYSYAKIWEYYPKENQQGDDAEEVSAPIPRYVPSGIKWMTASPRVKALLMFSDETPNQLYVYKFFWAQAPNGVDRKVQSSWGTWTFPDCQRIHWAGFMQNFLYVMVQRADGLMLERIRMDEETYDLRKGLRILLDRSHTMIPTTAVTEIVHQGEPVTFQGTPVVMSLENIRYLGPVDQTRIILPYPVGPAGIVVCAAPLSGQRLDDAYLRKVVSIRGNMVYLEGDLRGHVIIIGVPYTFSIEFSKPYIRQTKGQGETVLLTPRLQMRHLDIEYHDTAYFTATTKLPGRTPKTVTFDGKMSGIHVPLSGTFKCPLLGRNLDVTLTIDNPSPFNCSFGSAEWYAIYAPKTQRV